METKNPQVRRRRTNQNKREIKKPFFRRKINFLNMHYWEVSIFFLTTLFILLGLFRYIIITYVYDKLGWH